MNKLRDRYIDLVADYSHRFCEYLAFENPSINCINSEHDNNTVISINDDYFLSLDDIRYVLDKKISPARFFKWWDYSMMIGMVGLKIPTLPEFTAKGFKPKSKKEIRAIKMAQIEVDKAKEKLEDYIRRHS